MATAYLLYGYDIGDPTSTTWELDECARFGHTAIEECPQLAWLCTEDEYGNKSLNYEDIPDVIARRALSAFLSKTELDGVDYAWTYLTQRFHLTVKRVGWDDHNHMILCLNRYAEADEAAHVQSSFDLRVSGEEDETLRKAYAALDLAPDRRGADAPRWMLGVLH